MKAFLVYIILMDILYRTTPTVTDQSCNALSNRYYYEAAAQANTAYTFNWPTAMGTYVPTKLAVGAVQFVIEYDAAGEKVIAAGPCGGADWSAFQVSDKTLIYEKNGFSFQVQCFIEDNSPLKIKVLPQNNTSIEGLQ